MKKHCLSCNTGLIITDNGNLSVICPVYDLCMKPITIDNYNDKAVELKDSPESVQSIIATPIGDIV